MTGWKDSNFKIPEKEFEEYLEQHRERKIDNICPYKNYGNRINFDELQQVIERLKKAELRVLNSMLKRMHFRNMVMFTRVEIRLWLKEDYNWSPPLKHISSYYKKLKEKSVVKEVRRRSDIIDNSKREDFIVCCVNPFLVLKGRNKDHVTLINEWNDNKFTFPRGKMAQLYLGK